MQYFPVTQNPNYFHYLTQFSLKEMFLIPEYLEIPQYQDHPLNQSSPSTHSLVHYQNRSTLRRAYFVEINYEGLNSFPNFQAFFLFVIAVGILQMKYYVY